MRAEGAERIQRLNFYRPDPQLRTPKMRSPEYVQMSTAAAITLGLVAGRMHRTACTHRLNLRVTYPEGCRANCAYCGLARHREEARDYADRNFIRVGWPAARYEEVIARVRAGGDRGRFQRMCLSMITHPRSNGDTLVLLEKWIGEVPGVPVSILSSPTSLARDDLVRMKAMGADVFTVALDAVTLEIFDRTRGRGVCSPHTYARYWRTREWAAEVFGPEKVGARLICGMGETEREILEVAQRIEQMRFDASGRVSDFGLRRVALEPIIASGKPFRTSGCPGKDDDEVSACNRPYGDSSPSDILSFPFAPAKRDLQKIRRQMDGGEVRAGR